MACSMSTCLLDTLKCHAIYITNEGAVTGVLGLPSIEGSLWDAPVRFGLSQD